MSSLNISKRGITMKKTLIFVMAAVCIFATLLVSCSNEAKLSDETVSIRFGFDQSRGLNASQNIPNVDDLYWYYKAKRTVGSDSVDINLGETTDWTRVNRYSKGLNGIITLSQGIWDFELQGRKTTSTSTAVYQGSISNVLIYRNGDNVNTIEVPVSQLTAGNGSVVISNEITVKKNSSSNSVYSPTHYKYKSTSEGTYIEDELNTNEEGALVDTRIPLAAGTYDFVVMYKGTETNPGTGESIIYASAPITVTVSGNIETIITGSLDVVTASAEFRPQVDGSNTATVTPSDTETVSVFVPISPREEQGTGTTVSFDAGALPSDTTKLVTEVKTVEEAQSANFTVTNGYNAVAAIDLKVTNADGSAQQINTGKKVTVTTFIMTGLENVIVQYNGLDGNDPIANSEATNNKNVAIVYPAGTEDNGQLGYFMETGLLRFTVDHFSEFFVETDAICYNADTNRGYSSLPSALNFSSGKIVLLKDVDLSDNTATYIVSYFSGELEGNSHKIKFGIDSESKGQYLFRTIEGSSIKNLEVEMRGFESSLAEEAYGPIVFEKVKVTGNLTFGNNCGPFVIYDYTRSNTMKFIGCEMAATINGKGARTNYNSAFVGYPMTSYVNYEFTDCILSGSLRCGTAALFIANDCQCPSGYTIKVNNFSFTDQAEIRSTYTGSDAYSFDGIVAAKINCSRTITINGVNYSLSDLETRKTGIIGDFFQYGPTDSSLRLEENDDGTFTIHKAANERVTKYVISVSVYTSYTGVGGGSLLQTVSQTIEATNAETYTSTIKNLKFVDNQWVTEHPEASRGQLCGHTIYTLGSTSYYIIPESENANVGGVPKSAQSIALSAYSGDKLIASCGLTK